MDEKAKLKKAKKAKKAKKKAAKEPKNQFNYVAIKKPVFYANKTGFFNLKRFKILDKIAR